MRPVSAPAVGTGGTSSASVELPTPLNALTGSAGPLGWGGAGGPPAAGGGSGVGVLMLARMFTSWTTWPLPRWACGQPAAGRGLRRRSPAVRRALRPGPAASVRRQGGHCRAFAAKADTVEADKDPKLAAAVEELAAIAAIAAQAELERAGPHPPPAPLFQTPAAVVAADGQTLICQ